MKLNLFFKNSSGACILQEKDLFFEELYGCDRKKLNSYFVFNHSNPENSLWLGNGIYAVKTRNIKSLVEARQLVQCMQNKVIVTGLLLSRARDEGYIILYLNLSLVSKQLDKLEKYDAEHKDPAGFAECLAELGAALRGISECVATGDPDTHLDPLYDFLRKSSEVALSIIMQKYEAENASSKASKQKAGAKSKTAGASSQKEQDLPPVDIDDAYADFCYRIFGLTPKTLTKDSLEQAYSRLCLHYHPNLNSSKDVFEKLFEVQKAYACLRDVLQKRNEAQSNR